MQTQSFGPVLVTGASSGIGNHLTRFLAGRGCAVYATARKDRDLAELEAIPNVIPVLLDVQDPAQVLAARETVLEAGRGLYGLVHNAGVGGLGLLGTWSEQEMLSLFETNVFGVHRTTNAFLPLLLEARGRIVNVGSQGGIITKKYYGPYTMTKHALEAYTVALHEELRPYGVHVSIVQPGGIVTKVGESSLEDTLARFRRAAPPFRDEARQMLAALTAPAEPQDDAPESETNRKPSSPRIVSEAVHDALFSEAPKLRYLVGTRWEGDRVLDALVEKLLDENDCPTHRLTRDELVTLLERHIQARQGRA
jgi:NAD(P)-dependent dehydrogenase (short-subunit alcohol dehydrogenase family)